MVNQVENEEIREDRRLDRWIVNLADFLQEEKYQLLKLQALQQDKPKTDWNFRTINKKINEAIDEQLYHVYQVSFSKDVLAKHGLTHKREDFEAVMYIDPALLTMFQTVDDHYIECYTF